MTMFTLPNFCRVCLKYDKNLIDLAHIENEPSETLLSKLQQCVSEVEWNVFKPLLCHPCIKRLNIAYGFKKQCVQSSGVLKNYIELLKDSQKKNESLSVKTEAPPQPQIGSVMLLPNQKYVKILVGAQNQAGENTFQNVFLNLIPAATLSTATTTPVVTENVQKNKDTNQNVFLNINNTFQKYVPIAPNNNTKRIERNPTPQVGGVNVNQLLTESKSEELSVEIDPLDFTGLEEGDGNEDSNEEESQNDWDEMIPSKIASSRKEENGVNGNKSVLLKSQNYVPILPKQPSTDDFISSGQHFLSSSFENSGGDFPCERCSKQFTSIRLLKQHIKLFHLGKLPYKCEFCFCEFAIRSDYEVCVRGHKLQADQVNSTLTLQDFMNTKTPGVDINEEDLKPTDNGDYICNVCKRVFNSATGLLRHKVRKHNQKNKKKYFIKGMKNAKCDICNREFSTQSYMQLHRKLHMRDDIGYKYKVFGKSKYVDKEGNSQEEAEEGVKEENISVTPDIVIKNEEDSDSQEDNGEEQIKMEEDEEEEDEEEDDEDRLKMDLENGENSENEGETVSESN